MYIFMVPCLLLAPREPPTSPARVPLPQPCRACQLGGFREETHLRWCRADDQRPSHGLRPLQGEAMGATQEMAPHGDVLQAGPETRRLHHVGQQELRLLAVGLQLRQRPPGVGPAVAKAPTAHAALAAQQAAVRSGVPQAPAGVRVAPVVPVVGVHCLSGTSTPSEMGDIHSISLRSRVAPWLGEHKST